MTTDLVAIVFTNPIADPDTPFPDSITSTSGLVNGLPLGQIVLSFFLDTALGLDASTFQLSDLLDLQASSSLVVLTALFDADVDATGVEIPGGPRLALAAIEPSVTFSATPIPLPAGGVLFVAGLATIGFIRKRSM